MPNCDFYAAATDHKLLLDFVFALGDCDVYELSSPVDQRLARFQTPEEVRDRYRIPSWEGGAQESILLQIHPRDARGHVRFEKTVFSPEYKGPGTFKYESSGWGLIQLYLEPPRARQLRPSHTNHNSEKRALAWEQTIPNLGPVSEWDWSVVDRWSRRLNRFIKKSGVDTFHRRPVLPEAQRLSHQGLRLTLQ